LESFKQVLLEQKLILKNDSEKLKDFIQIYLDLRSAKNILQILNETNKMNDKVYQKAVILII
jgi:hypothetical protein